MVGTVVVRVRVHVVGVVRVAGVVRVVGVVPVSRESAGHLRTPWRAPCLATASR